MKAIIEKSPELDPRNLRYAQDNNKQMTQDFVNLLIMVTNIDGEDNLRNLLRGWDSEYFKVGFGGSHMWVKQILENGSLSDRILFVPFDEYTINNK